MATKTKKKVSKQELVDAYLRILLNKGEKPNSIFSFADEAGLTEEEFYTEFTSFEAIEEFIWMDLMDHTLKSIRNDEAFQSFSSREKLLSFYYAHLQVLLKKRSYIVFRSKHLKKGPKTPFWLKSYKQKFIDFAGDLVAEGIDNQEIKDRPYLSNRYDNALWFQLLFILDYWSTDNSAQFENTDAAIEKAVDLSFKLLGESTLDSALDFAKFIWQSK